MEEANLNFFWRRALLADKSRNDASLKNIDANLERLSELPYLLSLYGFRHHFKKRDLSHVTPAMSFRLQAGFQRLCVGQTKITVSSLCQRLN